MEAEGSPNLSSPVRAYLGLGSNVGDRAYAIQKALAGLATRWGIEVVQRSRLYETHPVGGPEGQALYLNAAAAVDTFLEPAELLSKMHEVEDELGRVRAKRWGPRTIDLDLLLYGDRIVEEPRLTVPHPRLHERGFVLAPLTEIAADVRHPKFDKTIGEMLLSLGDASSPADPDENEKF